MFTWGHLYTNVHLNQYWSVERIFKWMFLKDFGHFHVFVIESKRLKSDWYHTSLCVEGLIDYLYIWGLFSSPGAVMISSMFTFFVPTCVTSSLHGIQALQALKHTTKSVYANDLASPDGHDSFACEVQYLTTLVYGCFALILSYRKLW